MCLEIGLHRGDLLEGILHLSAEVADEVVDCHHSRFQTRVVELGLDLENLCPGVGTQLVELVHHQVRLCLRVDTALQSIHLGLEVEDVASSETRSLLDLADLSDGEPAQVLDRAAWAWFAVMPIGCARRLRYWTVGAGGTCSDG